MRFILPYMLGVLTLFFMNTAFADGSIGEPFHKEIYVKYGGSALNSGSSYAAAKSCAADGDLWAIPAGTLITKVYIVVDTLLTGTTDIDIGDDDNQDGFVDGSLSVDVGTVGVYGWNAKTAGAYLRVETAGASVAEDIYVVPMSKFYSATGKEVKNDIYTACTAGRYRVIVEGFMLGTK